MSAFDPHTTHSYTPRPQGSVLPPSLFILPSLTNVVAEGSGITGTLPVEICQASNIETLYLNGNELEGPLPFCLTHLQRLRKLYLSDNQLTVSRGRGRVRGAVQ